MRLRRRMHATSSSMNASPRRPASARLRTLSNTLAVYLLAKSRVVRAQAVEGRARRRQSSRSAADAILAENPLRKRTPRGNVRVANGSCVVSARNLELHVSSRLSAMRRGAQQRRRTRCKSRFWDSHSSSYNLYDDDAKTAYEVLDVEPDADGACMASPRVSVGPFCLASRGFAS